MKYGLTVFALLLVGCGLARSDATLFRGEIIAASSLANTALPVDTASGRGGQQPATNEELAERDADGPAPMPFGKSCFGPWNVPQSAAGTPQLDRRPTTIDFVEKDFSTVLTFVLLPGTNENVYESAERDSSGAAPMPFGRSCFGPWNVPLPARGLQQPANPSAKIDFVQEEFSTILIWLAWQAGAEVEFSHDFEDTLVTSEVSPTRPLSEAKELCRQYGRVFTASHKQWYVAMPGQQPQLLCEVLPTDVVGRLDVRFQNAQFVSAVLAVAVVSDVDVSVEAPDTEHRTHPRVSFSAKATTADHLLRKLAELAGMEVKFSQRKLGGGSTRDNYELTWPKGE